MPSPVSPPTKNPFTQSSMASNPAAQNTPHLSGPGTAQSGGTGVNGSNTPSAMGGSTVGPQAMLQAGNGRGSSMMPAMGGGPIGPQMLASNRPTSVTSAPQSPSMIASNMPTPYQQPQLLASSFSGSNPSAATPTTAPAQSNFQDATPYSGGSYNPPGNQITSNNVWSDPYQYQGAEATYGMTQGGGSSTANPYGNIATYASAEQNAAAAGNIGKTNANTVSGTSTQNVREAAMEPYKDLPPAVAQLMAMGAQVSPGVLQNARSNPSQYTGGSGSGLSNGTVYASGGNDIVQASKDFNAQSTLTPQIQASSFNAAPKGPGYTLNDPAHSTAAIEQMWNSGQLSAPPQTNYSNQAGYTPTMPTGQLPAGYSNPQIQAASFNTDIPQATTDPIAPASGNTLGYPEHISQEMAQRLQSMGVNPSQVLSQEAAAERDASINDGTYGQRPGMVAFGLTPQQQVEQENALLAQQVAGRAAQQTPTTPQYTDPAMLGARQMGTGSGQQSFEQLYSGPNIAEYLYGNGGRGMTPDGSPAYSVADVVASAGSSGGGSPQDMSHIQNAYNIRDQVNSLNPFLGNTERQQANREARRLSNAEEAAIRPYARGTGVPMEDFIPDGRGGYYPDPNKWTYSNGQYNRVPGSVGRGSGNSNNNWNQEPTGPWGDGMGNGGGGGGGGTGGGGTGGGGGNPMHPNAPGGGTVVNIDRDPIAQYGESTNQSQSNQTSSNSSQSNQQSQGTSTSNQSSNSQSQNTGSSSSNVLHTFDPSQAASYIPQIEGVAPIENAYTRNMLQARTNQMDALIAKQEAAARDRMMGRLGGSGFDTRSLAAASGIADLARERYANQISNRQAMERDWAGIANPFNLAQQQVGLQNNSQQLQRSQMIAQLIGQLLGQSQSQSQTQGTSTAQSQGTSQSQNTSTGTSTSQGQSQGGSQSQGYTWHDGRYLPPLV